MGKPNPQVIIMQQRREIAALQQQILDLQNSFNLMKAFTVRQSAEVAQITLHRGFEFGPARNEQFELQFMEMFEDLAELVVEDGETDKNIEWSIDRYDRLLIEARGQVPEFRERFSVRSLHDMVPVLWRGDDKHG